MSSSSLTADSGEHLHLGEAIRKAAHALGFVRTGFARAEPFEEARAALTEWIASGYEGGLAYMRAGDDRADPRALLPSVRTIIAVALPYRGQPVVLHRSRDDARPLQGRVAAYAMGADYHRVLKDKLLELVRECEIIIGRSVESRACVDSAPLLEREAARRAGVGFTGKSTMTIAPGVGTYLLIGELLVDVDIEPSAPMRAMCGRCTLCLDACPTGAFVGPYVLDAKRCISYLTIENKGPVPRELRAPIGARVFGCDECQDVCPFNASDAERPAAVELEPHPDRANIGLVELLELGAAAYRKLVKRSAMRRIGREQLKRNAAIALGNSGDQRAVAPLCRAVRRDASALVRAHAAWALGELGGDDARRTLEEVEHEDLDPVVREEASEALRRCTASETRGSAATRALPPPRHTPPAAPRS